MTQYKTENDIVMDVIETGCGENVRSAIAKIISLAPCQTKFNGQWLVAHSKDDSPDSIYQKWDDDMKSAHEKHKKSKEYIESEKRRAEQDKKDQATVDSLTSDIVSEDSPLQVAKLLGKMSLISDNSAIYLDFKALKDKLEYIGVVANMNTGSDYDDSIESNKIYYVLGQVLHALESGMPPHPIVSKFAEEL